MREINVRISFLFYLLVERNAPDSIGTAPTFLGASYCLLLIVGVDTLSNLDGFIRIGILSSLECCFLAAIQTDRPISVLSL